MRGGRIGSRRCRGDDKKKDKFFQQAKWEKSSRGTRVERVRDRCVHGRRIVTINGSQGGGRGRESERRRSINSSMSSSVRISTTRRGSYNPGRGIDRTGRDLQSNACLRMPPVLLSRSHKWEFPFGARRINLQGEFAEDFPFGDSYVSSTVNYRGRG